jgi:hypothetical protein
VALVTLWLTLLLGPTAQSDGPSLADTLKWMHNFVTANGTSNSKQNADSNEVCTTGPRCEVRTDKFRFDSKGCSVTITHDAAIGSDYENERTGMVNLKDLDPNSVAVEDDKMFQGVWATTFNDRAVVKITDRGVVNGKNVSMDSTETTVGVGFRDRQDAQGFANAWKHVIILCSGKPSAF